MDALKRAFLRAVYQEKVPATKFTSLSRYVAFTLFKDNLRLSFRVLGTRSVFGIIGRVAPYAAAVLFAYDVAAIGYCVYECKTP